MEDLVCENTDIPGSVLRIERSSVFDGDGLRTIVLMKGYPLRCWWCSTSEGHHRETQTTLDKKITYDHIMTVEEVLVEVRKDTPFYFHSGGGVTISGGEILTRPEFVYHLLHRANWEDINTCIETSSCGGWDKIEPILSSANTAFMDIRVMDSEAHKQYAGADNEVILSNIRRARARKGGTKLIIRNPLIPRVNDSRTGLRLLGGFPTELPDVDHLQLLPYHRLGTDAYRKLGLTYQLPDAKTPSQEYMGRYACVTGKYVKTIVQCPPGISPVSEFEGVHFEREVETIALRYGLITAGNVIRVMHRRGELHADYDPSEIGISDINENMRKDYTSRGYKTFDNVTELVNNSEMIVLGVTPKIVGLIIDELKACYRSGQLMLTAVMGVKQPQYTEHLGEDYRIVICMPNMSSQVGEDVSAVSRSTNCTDKDMERVTAVLKSCGLVEEIPDGMMAEILLLNGSAPGFPYHIFNLMVKGMGKYGLDPDTTIRLFTQTMKGSAETILSSNISLRELEATLRLPGGATVTALEKVESMGFDAMYNEFVRVSVERCKELGRR